MKRFALAVMPAHEVAYRYNRQVPNEREPKRSSPRPTWGICSHLLRRFDGDGPGRFTDLSFYT